MLTQPWVGYDKRTVETVTESYAHGTVTRGPVPTGNGIYRDRRNMAKPCKIRCLPVKGSLTAGLRGCRRGRSGTSSRVHPETTVYVSVEDIYFLSRVETEITGGPGSGGTVPYGINYGHLPLIRDFMNEGSLLITSYVSY